MLLVGVLGLGLVDVNTAIVRADDAGLIRGDGCFEGCRLRVGVVDKLDKHLARMARSAQALEIWFDEAAWRALIDLACAAVADLPEAALKLVLTRGHEGRPTGFLTVTAVEHARARREGVAVITLDRGLDSDAFGDRPWLLGGVKTLSYAINMAAYREAERRGAEDVIFMSTDGYVLECPTSTVVWSTGSTLHTTPTGFTGILAGTTSALLFERAAEWTCVETLSRLDEVEGADGLWLISSVRGPVEVRSVDGRTRPSTPALTGQIRYLTDF